MPKRLRYFLQRDPELQSAALRLFLRAVKQCLRAHSAGAGPTARPLINPAFRRPGQVGGVLRRRRQRDGALDFLSVMVRMPEGPLEHVGDFALTVAPHTDVVAHITVTVVGETAVQG